MHPPLSRRRFIRTSAAIAAPGILRAQNANSAVHVGWIGVGSRGYYLLERLYNGSPSLAQVTAVCDTYTGNLDGGNAASVFALMLELNRERGTSLVVVTHDLRLAERMERVYELERGVLTEREPAMPLLS